MRSYSIDELNPTETTVDLTRLDAAFNALKGGADLAGKCQVTTANGSPFIVYGTEYAVLLAINKRRFVETFLREDRMSDMDAEVCDIIARENQEQGIRSVRDLIATVPDRTKYWILDF